MTRQSEEGRLRELGQRVDLGDGRMDRPAIPSSGRRDTSSVALSSLSSLILTSIGPEKEPTIVLGPVNE